MCAYIYTRCAAKSLPSYPTVRPAHQAPPPLRFSRQSTGVGCHFLLRCLKVKSESEVTHSCPTPGDPMDCSLLGSFFHGIFQARVLEWVCHCLLWYIHIHSTKYVCVCVNIYIFGYGCIYNWKGTMSPSPDHHVRLPLSSSTAFPVDKLLKNTPAMQEIPVGFPGSVRSPGKGIGYPLQYSWASPVAQLVKNPPAMWEAWVQSLGWEYLLEEGKATHSRILAWIIQSMGSQRVRHNWATFTFTFLEKGMETHSTILAWRIPWTEDPGRLQSMGLQRVGHDWATFTFLQQQVSAHSLLWWDGEKQDFIYVYILFTETSLRWNIFLLALWHLHFNLSQKTIYKHYVSCFFLLLNMLSWS